MWLQIGLCLYCNKVVQHATYENHTQNHTCTCQNHTRACGIAVSL
jgi:hypothetical protein